jgi:hypothetical protein
MKISAPLPIKFIAVLIGIVTFGNTYSQNKNTTEKIIFGRVAKAPAANPTNGKVRCLTTEYEQFLQEKNPNRMSNAQFENWLSPLIAKHKAMKTSSKTAGTVITIPVVVHVIHGGEAIGVAPNITDAQVLSQIKVLNEDFRKMAGTPGGTNPSAADIEIQFELAKQDPNGNPTNGIDRVSLGRASWSTIDIEATLKPATIWDPTLYMNMWSLVFTDNTILGYAQFPDASGLPGLSSSGGASNTDGVVSNYNVFGSIDSNDGTFILNGTYNKGRTMTHEVGHLLGLLHIWGDGGSRDSGIKDCTKSDYCEDTPQAGWENYDCPVTPYDSCPTDPGNDMVENYMDYTNDACMNIFTLDQKTRINTVMDNSPRRVSLKTSTKGTVIPLFANDAELKIEAGIPTVICGAVANQTKQKITIINRGSSNLTAATLNYKINSGSSIAYNWTGNLATNNQDTFEITINSASNGTISVNVVTANGVADERATNNSSSGNFIIPPVAPNYAYTDYVFRLQRDLWGSETSWDLKDGSGAIVKSGGGYDDQETLALPLLITENWTLANNQCYTFTIYDSVGDGICCGTSGNGYYDIKTNNGAIIVKSGSSFTTSEYVTFTTNTLATASFDSANDIYLYPNPTKDFINISIPSEYGLPNSLILNNSLGQIISRKEVAAASDLSLNTSSLSNGVYFIIIAKDTQTKTLQFIKE